MKSRKPVSKKRTRKTFGKNANRTHAFNIKPKPMRGGIRM